VKKSHGEFMDKTGDELQALGTQKINFISTSTENEKMKKITQKLI
jgi:hypothetical protein